MDPLKFQPNSDNIPDDHLVDAADTGWRKYFLTFVTLGILVWGFWFVQTNQLMQALYATFGGLILAAVAAYMTANIATKVQGGVINLKNAAAAKPAEPEVKDADPTKAAGAP